MSKASDTLLGRPFWLNRLLALRATDYTIRKLDMTETLARLVEEGSSISRFGDGELKIALYGRGLRFQRFSAALRQQLIEALVEPRPAALPSINSQFMGRESFDRIIAYERYPKTADRTYSLVHPDDIAVYDRRRQIRELEAQWRVIAAHSTVKTYGSAGVFYLGFYLEAYREGRMEEIFEQFRKLFRSRRILFVGPKTPGGGASFEEQLPLMQRLGLKSAQFIAIPEQHAFEASAEILAEIGRRTGFDDIFLQAGPAATVWANQLAGTVAGRVLDVGTFNTQLRYLG